MSRELTCDERKGIRKLVTGLCANYDKEYGCLPLDCPCYMLGKWWTSAYCRYFVSAVLPTDPLLQASITNEMPDSLRLCAVCEREFIPKGKEVYCSGQCAEAARRKRQREYMRKRRVRR